MDRSASCASVLRRVDRRTKKMKQECMFTAVVERGRYHQYLLAGRGGGSGEGRHREGTLLSSCAKVSRYRPSVCPSERSSTKMKMSM